MTSDHVPYDGDMIRFLESYRAVDQYPETLLYDKPRRRSRYHRYQLDSNARNLFIEQGDESEILVPIRDFQSYGAISSNYLSFIASFGSLTGSLGFGGFRSEVSLEKAQFASEKLGRSGKHIKLSYSIETIQRNQLDQVRTMNDPNLDENDPHPDAHVYWLRPQAAIHHQFDTETGASLWIITSPLILTKNKLGNTV
ncbi:hypothetical protein PG985_003917 [Apiospora marii]|uniref:uncharacterized protein n=1 Tax=Apiospora marii TaxID=335849 RepID=UPI003131EB40